MRAAEHIQQPWPSTESEVIFLWQQAMDSMINGDKDLARKVFASDALWYDMFVGTVTGVDRIAELLGGMKGSTFEATVVEPLRVFADESEGMVEWVQTLYTGERRTNVEGVTVLGIRDGQIVRLCDYIHPLKNRKP